MRDDRRHFIVNQEANHNANDGWATVGVAVFVLPAAARPPSLPKEHCQGRELAHCVSERSSAVRPDAIGIGCR
jgi:hypothetical protein